MDKLISSHITYKIFVCARVIDEVTLGGLDILGSARSAELINVKFVNFIERRAKNRQLRYDASPRRDDLELWSKNRRIIEIHTHHGGGTVIGKQLNPKTVVT